MCVFGKQSFGDFDMHMLFYTCPRTPSFIPDIFLEDLLYIRHFAKHWGPGDEGHSFFPLRCSQSPGRKLMNNYNMVGSSRNTSGLCRAVRAVEGEGVTAACKWGSLLGICSELARIREKAPHSERLHFHFSLSCIGEGNGNPLQCSCLENPRDGGAWWAAVYGVTQSWTRLKWLSSSSKDRRVPKGRSKETAGRRVFLTGLCRGA